MNLFHRWYCNSKGWAQGVQQYMLPNVVGETDLGDNVLEVGPGPGVTTDWLRTRVPHLTAVEIDHKLAAKLQARLQGTNVTVIEGDATALTLPENSFSAALSFTMLHHVPSAALQDKLLAEACRVLRPGAVFVGSDSLPSLRWNLYHLFDTRVPVDPATFEARLEAAGFVDCKVNVWGQRGFNWRARKPA
jgi:ubiquinone/menaquinone biosynthesis C-methylase UbiE